MIGFFSTGRFKYKYITQIGDLSSKFANDIPNLKNMQKDLIKSFPYDLWQ